MRSRKLNAAVEKRSFQSPRANVSIGADKPKPISEKVRPSEGKNFNIETKPIVAKKLVKKTKIINKEINIQPEKIAANQELKSLAKKLPAEVNKVAVQKKNLLAAAKIKTDVLVGEEIQTNKITKVSNMKIQKNQTQDKTPAIQNTKLENNISAITKKVQSNNTSAPTTKTNTTVIPDVKSQENAPKIKKPSEIAPNPNPTLEKKTQDTPKDEKVSIAGSAEKQCTEQPRTEQCPKFELDPLLARAVEEELQDIMIQVWQALPDEPPQQEDRIAVDKLRNEAGDELRRVLGLNITKRLLNVYNNLFVKMQFTCRPKMGCLTNFLDEYHITKFKRIDKNSNTFAAQMMNIEDFDKLCSVKELTCGEAKVSITPCYKFTQCPENLKTIYDDTYIDEDNAQEQIDSSKSKDNTKKTKVVSKENVIKPPTVVDNIDSKSSDVDKPGKKETQDRTNIVDNNSTCVKNEPEIGHAKNTADKSDGVESQKSRNIVSNVAINFKNNSAVVDKEKKMVSSKILNDDIKSKETVVPENIKNKNHKETAKAKNLSHNVIKDKLKRDDDIELELEVPECLMEGDEELNDEDILALMSEGVVLDECSGSEDEK